jgi:hypothetical protein
VCTSRVCELPTLELNTASQVGRNADRHKSYQLKIKNDSESKICHTGALLAKKFAMNIFPLKTRTKISIAVN